MNESFLFFSSFSCVPPAIIGFLNFKFLKRHDKVLLLLICAAVIVEIISLVFRKLEITNTELIATYTIIEFLSISVYYFLLIQFVQFKIVSAILCVVAMLLMAISGLFRDSVYFALYGSVLESVILVFFGFYHFYTLMRQDTIEKLLSLPSFWVSVAVLLYFGGNFFLFLLGRFLSTNDHMMLWQSVHNILNMLFYILISYAFWKTRPAQK
jgi:hypothetical protein